MSLRDFACMPSRIGAGIIASRQDSFEHAYLLIHRANFMRSEVITGICWITDEIFLILKSFELSGLQMTHNSCNFSISKRNANK